ncbi:hypothetical protein [Streptomyces sp. NPDC057496]|uniref:hypothetical protein n=1 Tax=Streptomyces sp. NPDC057496 TaxID=3346149 RepID=UPI003696F083
MHRRSKTLHGAVVTVLAVLALTACGGGEDSDEIVYSKNGGTAGEARRESPAAEKTPAAEETRPAEAKWGPGLTPGQPAPGLYEPGNTGGGKFEVAVTKVVKGTVEQMKGGGYDESDLAGDTPYFVYVDYTLKEGKPTSFNVDLNAHVGVLDEKGEQVAERPVVHTGYVDGGCPVADIYMGWDIGEKHTVCTVFVGEAANPPARLVWTAEEPVDRDYTKIPSWKWATQ